MRLWPLLLPALAAFLPHGSARAQGIDCSRARSATEKAICASPALLALDHQVAVAYADTLARRPDDRDAIRADLLRWLKSRDAACTVAPAAMEACLSRQLTARLAALAPPPAAAAPPTPAAATPDPVFADPAIPTGIDRPQPAARLDRASVPAAGEQSTLLHVSRAGRFTVAAKSPAGTALQLIDMLAGPGPMAGSAGSQDGRLDVLLDVGDYKLRSIGAADATGSAELLVTPFHDAAPPAAMPVPGRIATTTLADGEQRAFWLVVPPNRGANVRIEAAGRSLADLRLWRDGRSLAPLLPAARQTEPVPGHPLTDLVLTGAAEPGTYLAIAYGGPALRWTDSDAAQPLLVRSGLSPALAEGWAGGTIGPFGSEAFARPAAARLLRLDLPAPAEATLGFGGDTAAITRRSRAATAQLPADPAAKDAVVVSGSTGQAFALRALDQPGDAPVTRPGTYWVSAVTTGAGGDELPPTVILQRNEGGDRPARILASTAPVLSPRAGWHGRFNLRGDSTMLFQAATGVSVDVRTGGVALVPADTDAESLPAGFYRLALTPRAGASGALDLSVGAAAPVKPAWPADPVLPLGIQTVAAGQSLFLAANTGPEVSVGLSARPVPVALAEGPLLVTLPAGAGTSVPVQIAPGGTLSVTEVGGGPLAFGQQDNATPGRLTVVVPEGDHPRTVALAWHRIPTPPPPIPPPAPPGREDVMVAGTPLFLDLLRGERRSFGLTVAQGGLYRIETLGRLHTAGTVGTDFLPSLGAGDGNGMGQNMLVVAPLRAGRFRVAVQARDSAGHLGVSAVPAPLVTAAALKPGGSVRARIPAGSGGVVPVEIGTADRVRLDANSLGAPWTGRLEDAEGWPLAATGKLDGFEQALSPGGYRLVLSPDGVDRQVELRLVSLPKPVPVTGHGPHALPFGAAASATWREPDGAASRQPDRWVFTLPGEAAATLVLGDGMTAELFADNQAAPLARVVGRWTGTLPAGGFHLDATSLGRNDRLAYTVQLDTDTLQPGTSRTVTLPGSLPFSIAAERVVGLQSWGTTPVAAVIRDATGRAVFRAGPGRAGWDLLLSRRLPAERYTLDLRVAAPPTANAVAANPAPDAAAAEDDDDDDQAAQTDASRALKAADAADAAPDDDAAAPSVAVSLSLPPDLPAPEAAGKRLLTGAGVHLVGLPAGKPGDLLLATAAADVPIAVSLERKGDAGWRTVATGPSLVAAVADDDPAPWRVAAWALSGQDAAIDLAAGLLDTPAAAGAELVALENQASPVSAAHVALDAPGVFSVGPRAIRAGDWPGHALAAPDNGGVVATGRTLWVLGSRPGPVAVAAAKLDRLPLLLPAGLEVPLPVAAGPSLWRVESAGGRPSLGGHSGLADNSAVALAEPGTVLRNALDAAAGLRVRLSQTALTAAPERALDGSVQMVVPPGAALPLTLRPGDKHVAFDLAPGLAAIAGPLTIWSGDRAISRSADGDWTRITLVNAGTAPAAAHLAVQPGPAATVLRPGGVARRFFGAAGSFVLAVEGAAGATVHVSGGQATLLRPDGTVRDGAAMDAASGGALTVTHGAGPVAVWMDAPGRSAWSAPSPVATALPARVVLSGPAQAVALQPGGPALLAVSTTAPVLLAVGDAPPMLFGSGAALPLAVAGDTVLRFFSATDGPLSGTATLSAEPLLPLSEGIGTPVTVAPGNGVAWSFTLPHPATVGIGLRADPDGVSGRLLDAEGHEIAHGAAMMRALKPGRFILEATVPPDGKPTLLRPALLGTVPRPDGPPPEVVRSFLELAGLKPQGTSR